ncbi:MAG: transposase, partial [Thermoproteota archaeon]
MEEGVWKSILEALMAKGCLIGKLSLEKVAVDSTAVEARKGGALGYDGHKHRKGSKIHVAVSRGSLPLSVVVGSGEEHDSKRFVEVVDGIRVK